MAILSIVDYSALFQKCQYEIAKLTECTTHPERDYLMINLIIGLNHLFEWYLKDRKVDVSAKLLCINQFNPYKVPPSKEGDEISKLYRKLQNRPNTNRNQEVIRELCNKAKHLKEKEIEVGQMNYICGMGDEHVQCGEPFALSGSFNYYNYFVDMDGKEIDLISILRTQIEEWSKFISSTNNVAQCS